MTRYDEWATHLDPELDEQLTGPEAAALDRIAESLSDAALWDEPPASLRDGLLAAAEAERERLESDDPTRLDAPPNRSAELPRIEVPSARETTPAPDASESDDEAGRPAPSNVIDLGDGPPTGRPSAARSKARSRWFGNAMVAVAAAAVAVIATIAVPRILDDSDSNISTFEVAGTELAPDAVASVDVEPLAAGVAITLNITGLPPAGEGQYYAGWLTSPDGEQVPIGSFHWREGGIPIELWSGVDVERYPTLGITLQNEGEPTTSNGQLVLKGPLVALTE